MEENKVLENQELEAVETTEIMETEDVQIYNLDPEDDTCSSEGSGVLEGVAIGAAAVVAGYALYKGGKWCFGKAKNSKIGKKIVGRFKKDDELSVEEMEEIVEEAEEAEFEDVDREESEKE